MRYNIFLFFVFISITTFAQLTDTQIKDLQTGRMRDDTSYVYSLPYKKGKKFFLIQGSNSRFSHRDLLAFDFLMRKGRPIHAARNGVVSSIKCDSNKRGLKKKYLTEGNYVIIEHDDGSEAQYWHLKLNGVCVKVGDTIQQNQMIGYSGNTGYSAFPHLHFQVLDKDDNQILPRFKTRNGDKYLRAGRWYRSE